MSAMIQTPASAATEGALFGGNISDSHSYLYTAGADDRQDRRDCRQDEGVVGEDKRDCKQEEVRDGVRGNRG